MSFVPLRRLAAAAVFALAGYAALPGAADAQDLAPDALGDNLGQKDPTAPPVPRPSPFAGGALADDPFAAIDSSARPANADEPPVLSFDAPDLDDPIAGNTMGPMPPRDLVLEARLTDGGEIIPNGVTWRVFAEVEAADGKLPLVAEASGGTVTLALEPGAYYLHAAYGRAGATKQIRVAAAGAPRETVVLNAGGLRLHALVGEDVPLDATDVSFDIYADDSEDSGGERTLVVPDAEPDLIVRLNNGTYHVVSRYGDTNAIVRADIEVKAGELTDATLYHQAAKVTLKLVSVRGGEALANTAWSVLTPGGDAVFDSVGAFPTVVLAAGEYTAIAKNNGQIYESQFKVEAAVNRDIEVLAAR